jgi:hypothetical protein
VGDGFKSRLRHIIWYDVKTEKEQGRKQWGKSTKAYIRNNDASCGTVKGCCATLLNNASFWQVGVMWKLVSPARRIRRIKEGKNNSLKKEHKDRKRGGKYVLLKIKHKKERKNSDVGLVLVQGRII